MYFFFRTDIYSYSVTLDDTLYLQPFTTHYKRWPPVLRAACRPKPDTKEIALTDSASKEIDGSAAGDAAVDRNENAADEIAGAGTIGPDNMEAGTVGADHVEADNLEADDVEADAFVRENIEADDTKDPESNHVEAGAVRANSTETNPIEPDPTDIIDVERPDKVKPALKKATARPAPKRKDTTNTDTTPPIAKDRTSVRTSKRTSTVVAKAKLPLRTPLARIAKRPTPVDSVEAAKGNPTRSVRVTRGSKRKADCL